jgi:hypothetical protein
MLRDCCQNLVVDPTFWGGQLLRQIRSWRMQGIDASKNPSPACLWLQME